MCGICGFTGESDDRTLRAMLASLVHRGPDSEGVYSQHGVSLGCRRLRIVDPAGGDQPISNEAGDVTIVYNGEIYNADQLRRRLQSRGHRFASDCDTEIPIHLYEEYGDDFARHLNGMFAFALWDAHRRRLLLVRDQVGIKPLCYYWDGKTLVFGSEIKAILQHPRVTAMRDHDATHLLLNTRFIPSPHTLFKGIRKLPPGHQLVWQDGKVELERYWEWDTEQDESLTQTQCAEQLFGQLSAAIKRQISSDEPIGAFLSGGLDSSAIVALSTEHARSMHTFSLGFNEPTDELSDARLIARHFGTQHHEATVPARPLAELPRVIYHVEEPKVNALQGYLVSGMASRFVRTALSGLGADELHAGYDIHKYLRVVDGLRRICPAWLARAGAGSMSSLGRMGDRLFGMPFENYRRGFQLAAHLHRPDACYAVLRNAWDMDATVAHRIYSPEMLRRVDVTALDALTPFFDHDGRAVSGALRAEFNLKMVDDFLHNEDRTSMAHSLEVRVPMLDLELVQATLRMPLQHRFAGGNSKHSMKQALRGVLPQNPFNKRKQGFSFDPHNQFKRDLRSVARRVLTPENVERLGIFNLQFLTDILDHRPSPRMRWHYFMLWMAVGLHFWHEIFIEGRDANDLSEEEAALTCPTVASSNSM